MAYDILAKDGRPIMKDGDPVKAMDLTVEKVEQLDDTNKTFVAVASTEDEDRDKDIIRQDGWNLKNFKKNPMIPWSHDYWGVPIARSLRTWIDHDAKKLMFKPQFDSEDDASMKIFNKYKNGFLTSFSVGFRGLEFEYRDEDDRWWGGIEFLQQELLEISAVTIPANPNATVSVHGGDAVQNLLQMGYPQMFAETDQGLFYPVRELGEFISPEIKIGDEEGIQVMYANSISESSDGTGDPIPVGYFFDPNAWKTGDIQPWIKDNAEQTYKHHYYNWKYIEEDKTWEVESQEEEKEIAIYDEDPVKVDIKVITTDDVPEGDEDDLPDDILLQLTEAVEKIIKENMIKLTDSLGGAFDEIFDKIMKELDDIKKLVTEKELDIESNLDDNVNDDDDDDDDPDKSDSKSNDDEIEIDDSLISPDDDKSNSDDDTIEIDDDVLDHKEIANSVDGAFRQKLKETFEEVAGEKSVKDV